MTTIWKIGSDPGLSERDLIRKYQDKALAEGFVSLGYAKM
jgi:hypothetical protein